MSKEFMVSTPAIDLGIRISTASVAVASLLASGIATYHMHQDEGSHTWEFPVWEGYDVDHTDVTTQPLALQGLPAGTGFAEKRSVSQDAPIHQETSSTQEIKVSQAAYARNYDQDKAAEAVDHQSAAQQIHEAITGLQQEGWSDIHLVVQGHASAEDDMSRPDAGLQTPGPKNVDTANKRADSLINYLKTDPTLAAYPAQEVEGTEGVVADDQFALAQDMSKQYGYHSVSDMIENWNTGKPMPPPVDALLESMLGKDRTVTVTVKGSRTIPQPNGTVITEEAICIMPMQQVTTDYLKYSELDLPIPKFFPILLPGFVPFIRIRRRKAAPGSVALPDLANDLPLLPEQLPVGKISLPGLNRLPGVAGGGGFGGERPKQMPEDEPEPVVDEPGLTDDEPTEATTDEAPETKPAEEETKPDPADKKGCGRVALIGATVSILLLGGAIYLVSKLDDTPGKGSAPSGASANNTPPPVTIHLDPCTKDMPQEPRVVQKVKKTVTTR